MLWHALRGLPRKEEGGSIDSNDAREVKGYLLGQVEFANKRRVVTIKEIVQLPFNEQDAGDAAYFNAQDRAILEKKLRSRPSLQLVGNYHSHPNHEIKLSDQDVVYLSQYLPENYHVAAIVGPREPAVGFFLRNEQGAYTPWQEPVGRTRYTRANDVESGFAWKPDIEVVDAGGGNITYVQGKRTSRKAVWWSVGLAVVAVAAAAFMLLQRSSPVMGVVPTQVDLTSSGEQSKTIELKLDRKGEYTFIIVQTEDLPPWLEIAPTKG
ncbi:MAG TPA: Mov34/MPN/PAD-1 family protein, partial [Vicinamibacteria bacterium]|nr:Mov34/MPN/PAD-1 family protein [Vicinamibacteria bacterium]